MGKIRIEDLSVGDWVNIDDPLQSGAGQIVEIRSNIVLVQVPSCVVGARLESIEPIPITPKILEKNGLCVVEEDADFSEYELFGSENFSIFHTKGTLHYRLETPQASVACWNVHQLQHALRLAGVEKEIIL